MLIPTEPIWVDNDDVLRDLCAQWQSQAALAIDTEFMRSDTFYPIPGLLQVGDGKGCYLIDPLAITDIEPLKSLMQNQQVTKVLHSCSEDLEVFARWLGVIPEPIFDTQLAAAFSGFGYSLGYSALVKAAFNIDVPKDETRSDWLQRPLSVAQLKYAALDVAHMLLVYGKLLQTLKASDRLEWVRSDCADIVNNARRPDDFLSAYKKVGFAFKLRPLELRILQRLCEWREVTARERDIPRNRLVKEASLWEIARKKITTIELLAKVAEVPSRTLRNDGEHIIQMVQSVLDEPETTWPARLDPPLAQSEGPLMKRLKAFVRKTADAVQLPPEVLISKKDYEFIIRSGQKGGSYALPPRLLGWRFAFIGQGLLAIANDPVIETLGDSE